MENSNIYEDIALRTGGNIYIGVVGPVRTGKSTFIKRFMETLVIPNIENEYVRERARDELPQSGSGRTIMTAEPKFVPEEAADIALDNGTSFSVRLIDCVGYMVEGAIGGTENGEDRMVTTPWFDHEITMAEAAEAGTHKVIAEHSTIGIVITTDGSVTDIERESYISAEERAIRELQEIGKPFIVLLNSANPSSESALRVKNDIMEKYHVSCISVNCMLLNENDILEILKSVLYEFPVNELGIFLPPWLEALDIGHPVKSAFMDALRGCAENVTCIKDVFTFSENLGKEENVSRAEIRDADLGSGIISVSIIMPRALFYKTVSDESGFDISDDGDLFRLLTELSGVKSKYDKIAAALEDVDSKGYGIVMPGENELILQEPEIVRKAGKYSVRLKASAPSIHMIRTNIETEVSPVVGGEKASEEILGFLLQGFEGDTSKLWESNIFGKSLQDIAGEGLQAKIKKMPPEIQTKLRDTLQRIINDGSNGLICIIL